MRARAARAGGTPAISATSRIARSRSFRDFRVLHYREGKFFESGEEAYRAGLFGQKVK